MDTVSLFAGCGGLDIGLERAGAKIVFANEIDSDACASLRTILDHRIVHEGDVRNVVTFPEADLLVGGYPCQSFSMGGNRAPTKDPRTYLYLEFARAMALVRPKYFIAENVSGLKKINGGTFLRDQIEAFEAVTPGYRITAEVVDAASYGVPQHRKRVLLVGVRRDLGKAFVFPRTTHGKPSKRFPFHKPFNSHGMAILGLPMWPTGEFYERPHDPEGHFSWYYMSRNRKAAWHGPSFTIVANWRHTTLHPSSPTMTLTWSNLADGWKQRWDFSDKYEHLELDPSLPVLEQPRRLSWRECALIQTFPESFEPVGSTESKIAQVGNAVPPLLGEIVGRHLVSGEGLYSVREAKLLSGVGGQGQFALW